MTQNESVGAGIEVGDSDRRDVFANDDRIRAAAGDDGVVIGIDTEQIIAGARVERHITAETLNIIIAFTGINRIVQTGNRLVKDRVITGAGFK